MGEIVITVYPGLTEVKNLQKLWKPSVNFLILNDTKLLYHLSKKFLIRVVLLILEILIQFKLSKSDRWLLIYLKNIIGQNLYIKKKYVYYEEFKKEISNPLE